jgi:phosphatidylglycerophosphate synthase
MRLREFVENNVPVEAVRQVANWTTYGRIGLNGAVLGNLANAQADETYTLGRAIAYSVVALADGIDGSIVRLHSAGPTPEGAALDQEGDKAADYATDITLALKHRDPWPLLNLAVNVPRDYIVNGTRARLREAGLDAKAQKLGKYKTALKGITNTLAFSPVAEKAPIAIRGLRVGSAIMSIVSGVSFVRDANRQLSEAKQQPLRIVV